MSVTAPLIKAAECIARAKEIICSEIPAPLEQSDLEKMFKEEDKHLNTILENFDDPTFNFNSSDRLTTEELKNAVGVYGLDHPIGQAAQYLLDNDELFDNVETANHNDDYLNRLIEGEFHHEGGDEDGRISREDITEYQRKRNNFHIIDNAADRIVTAEPGYRELSGEDFEDHITGGGFNNKAERDAIEGAKEDGALDNI